MSRIQKAATAILLGLLVLSAAIWVEVAQPFDHQASAPQAFDGERAMQDVHYQMSLGPRTVGSQAHAQTVDWIVSELEQSGWEAQVQESQSLGHPIRNVVGKWGQGRPWIVIGAHYDSRLVADQDPDPENRLLPVPGANDGASGVAVLLELARTLPDQLKSQNRSAPQIWLVFFDAEDNGNLPGWDWILGSQAFVASLENYPDAAVVVDMIGDKDLNVYQERNSDPELTRQIWSQANSLGYSDRIIPQVKYAILDDHIPFRDAGIPAVDMIDFDYPYWHTRGDTADKVSADSLKVIGDTLTAWLKQAP
ncbi:MAG: M28 family peptidase [Anaerolineales bacterium]